MMRTVVFSDEEAAKAINKHFVSAWVNKSPRTRFTQSRWRCPPQFRQATYPLGNGPRNVTSIFATPEGTVLHAVPGYLDVEAFTSEMNFALRLHDAITDAEGKQVKDASEIYKKLHGEESKVEFGPSPGKAHARLADAGILKIDKITFGYFKDFRDARG